MKTGVVIKSFIANDGRKVLLRTLKWEDLDDMMEFINALVEEGAEIFANQKVTREHEVEWLARQMVEVEKGNRFNLSAVVDGKLITNSSITRGTGYSEHVGILAIAIRDGYREIGIGTEMMNKLISQAESMGLRMLTLTVFSTNNRARHVYEKVGFREVGCIPKELYKDGKYIDHVWMVKELTSNP
ncbi:GNAT family N-acetyltransferase [Candidatus Bathyarchaeota archaeon]|nr:GNAT family N-acetyltransferase [Candidatus Bathyarchaeota archaeon]